jgi:hypothetical protein
VAQLLTGDEARRIAAKVAKLPSYCASFSAANLSKKKASTMPEPAKQPKLWPALFTLVLSELPQLIGGLFVLTLMYGVVVIISRYALGVELWNPFR